MKDFDIDLKNGCGNKSCGCHNGDMSKCRYLWLRNMFNHVIVSGKSIKAFPYSCPKGRHNCILCSYANSGRDAHSKRLRLKKELPFLVNEAVDSVHNVTNYDDYDGYDIDYVFDGTGTDEDVLDDVFDEDNTDDDFSCEGFSHDDPDV